jgi:phosphatidylinositol glycan class V
MLFLSRDLSHPIQKLVVLFFCWKLLLLLVATCSPSPSYDTSTSLVEVDHRKELPVILRHLISKLVRWDAVYYVKIAERYYLFEQEWAFGWGFTRAISFFAECKCFPREFLPASLRSIGLKSAGVNHYEGLEACVGISIAHLAHLLSVLLVYYLSTAVFPRSPPAFAFIAASLQVISPAGLFLSAPQAESSCAALSFAGCLLFAKSRRDNGQPSLWRDLCLLVSGIMFGMATTVRSNGILNGLLLLEEAFRTLAQLYHNPSFAILRRLIAAGVGGLSVGFGFLLPQYIAYTAYCGSPGNAPRIWCQDTLPSIYSFVQSHYWYVEVLTYL